MDLAFENGALVATYEPDIAAEVDARNGWEDGSRKTVTIEEALESRAEALKWFKLYCWTQEGSFESRRSAKEAANRFVALSVLLFPNIFSKGDTYQQLAKELDISRAELSKVGRKLARETNLQFRGQRNPQICKKNADARIKTHIKQRAADDEDRGSFFREFGGFFKRAAGANPILQA